MKEMDMRRKVCIWYCVLQAYLNTGKLSGARARHNAKKLSLPMSDFCLKELKQTYGEPIKNPTSIRQLFSAFGLDYDSLEWSDEPIPERWTK